MTSSAEQLSLLLRKIYPSVLAKLVRPAGSLPVAEDAVQEAVVRALRDWLGNGLPGNPEAWLVRAARNIVTDQHRHKGVEQAHASAFLALTDGTPWTWTSACNRWDDEMLRLILTCCDPSLELHEQAALTLATVVGLSPKEIANAFRVAPRAIEQRLVRARRRLRSRQGQYRSVERKEVPERVGAALHVIYLTFNEGYWATEGDSLIRSDLCDLSEQLAESMLLQLPTEPEVGGLLALLKLHRARLPARLDTERIPIGLPEQDRQLWDRGLIADAEALLQRSLVQQRPGPFQIEAAISSLHCTALDAEQTDWSQISLLYARLEEFRPSPVVRLNRAFAVSKAEGPDSAMTLLNTIAEHPAIRDYPFFFVVKAEILEQLEGRKAAVIALRRALSLARSEGERRAIEKRLLAIQVGH